MLCFYRSWGVRNMQGDSKSVVYCGMSMSKQYNVVNQYLGGQMQLLLPSITVPLNFLNSCRRQNFE